ncbi:MAG: alkaline phosphatase D family protein [Nocardioidaceae bacterium]
MTDIDRRTFLATGAAGAAVAASSSAALGLGAATDASSDSSHFRHGVASGDPLPHRVVLWTRVTPADRLTPGATSGPSVEVRWEVAADRRFERVVRTGAVTTSPRRDYTVKVDAGGLRPDTVYWYRFRFDAHCSPVGRTKTAPGLLSTPRNVRLGVVSCSNLQAGWFSAYRHLAARDDLDAVVHLGDYLYEYGPGEYGYGQSNRDIRPHVPAREMVSLADYRRRHGQYKTDPDLRRLHARLPFVTTWDDHETTNDAYRRGAENHQPDEGDYLERRARAYRAYDEWMPTRMSGTARLGDGTRLYRSLRFGRLAELSMLDLRTYRSRQVEPTDLGSVGDPDRSITGDTQMAWLKRQLLEKAVQWKVVGNPVMIAPVVFPPLPTDLTDAINDVTGLLPRDGVPYNVDQWDGYTADRRELFRHLADHGVQNTVFLTGDIHSGWACDLPIDAGTYPVSRTVGTEFVCTSVTSNNLDDITGTPRRTTSLAIEEGVKASNRHIKYLNFDDHGYSVVDVTASRLQMDYYMISERADRRATSQWIQSWATAADTQRVHQVDGPVA